MWFWMSIILTPFLVTGLIMLGFKGRLNIFLRALWPAMITLFLAIYGWYSIVNHYGDGGIFGAVMFELCAPMTVALYLLTLLVYKMFNDTWGLTKRLVISTAIFAVSLLLSYGWLLCLVIYNSWGLRGS